MKRVGILCVLIAIFLSLLSPSFTESLAADTQFSDGFDFPVGNPNDHSTWTISLGIGDSWSSGNNKRSYNGHLGEDYLLVDASGRNISQGQTVRAAAAGTVYLSKDLGANSGWGEVIILKHQLGNGEIFYSQYGHLRNRQLLENGQIVLRGQPIGEVGHIPKWVPHLHFEIKTQEAIDTEILLGVGPGYSGDKGEYWYPKHRDPSSFISSHRPTITISTDAGKVTKSSISLSWTQSQSYNFGSYKLYRATHPNVTTSDTLVTTVADRATTSYVDINLSADTTYYYRLFVFDSVGWSISSNEVAAKTAPMVPTWVSAGLQDKDVRAIVIDSSNPNIIYAATTTNVYQTVDAGISWTIETAYGSSLAISQSNPQIVYAVGSYGIYKTTDSGQSWVKLANSPNGASSVAVHPQNPDIVYVGTQGMVYKSADGGSSWQSYTVSVTNTLAWIRPLLINPIDPQILYAGTQGTGDGIFKSTDGGQSWFPINNGLPAPNPSQYPAIDVRSIATDPANANILYLGTDTDLTTWPNPPYPNTIAVFKSNNGGLTWEPTNLTFNTWTSALALAISPINTSKIFAGMVTQDIYGVYESVDSGNNWQNISNGLPAPHSNNMVSSLMFTTNGFALYAGTSKGIWRLDNF